MYAQLGNIVFENLKGFSTFSKTGSATFAEHQLIEGKPRLQKTGNGLDEISISLRLHVSFCNPDNELSALKAFRDGGEVLTLQYGNGKVVGDFVITTMEESVEDSDAQGNIFSYLVNLVLKEYVSADRLQQEQAENRRRATAVGDRKPVATRKVNPPPCATEISELVTQTENHSSSIDRVVLLLGGTVMPQNRYSVLSSLTSVKSLTADIIRRCDDPGSCAAGDTELRYRAEQVKNCASNFHAIVSSNQHNSSPSQNQILQATVRNLKVAARSFVNKTILRK